MKRKAFYYCFKILLTTLALSPFAFDILEIVSKKLSDKINISSAALLLLAPSIAMVSAPIVFLFWVAIIQLSKLDFPVIKLKTWLSLIGIALSSLYILLLWILEPGETRLITLIVPYQVVMVACIFKFDVNFAEAS